MNKSNQAKSVEAIEHSFSKAFLGLFVVIFGFIFLVNNSGLFSININFATIWPLLIIFIGLSLLKKKDPISTAMGSTVATICVALIFISIFSYLPMDYSAISSFPVSVAKVEGIKKAEITLNAGAGEVKVNGVDTGKIVEGNLITNLMTSKVNSQVNGSVQDVSVGVEGGKGWFHSGNLKNDFIIGIDKNTPVSLLINSGASNNSIDLSNIMAESVALHTGASNVDLKMGDNVDNANVAIEAGASSINLSFPKTAGVRIFLESGMSSQKLPDFISIDKNTYQSLNYEASAKKINVSIKMGMASLYTSWYEPQKKEIVSLYYYNQGQDKANSCGYQFVTPVQREIIVGDSVIKDTIDLLIKGQLSDAEKANGFTTGFPNPDFKLVSYNLSDTGTLTLTFTEVPGFTSGDSCRTGLLMEEILKTVRQFPEVKRIVFKPDSLFE